MTTQDTFRRARNRGVPIVGIETQDPAASKRWVITALNGTAPPFISWDCIQGFTGQNDAGQALTQELQPELPILNPAEALDTIARKLPDKSLAAFSNAQRYLAETPIMQAVWNCRDALKARGAMLILFGPSIKLPPELTQDAVILSEELPNETELGSILDSTLADAKIKATTIPDRNQVIDTLRGLSAFAAEQVLALSLSKTGIDNDSLWTRKARMIEQTPGLQCWRGGETFNDLGGLQNLKSYLTQILTSGKTPVRAIGFIDEIEKGMAGATGDNTGVSQDQLQVFLKVMQDLDIPGIILVGHAGTGKSCIAKGSGNVANAPVIAIDTGAMKQKEVGSSEASIRAAMDVFKAVSQGKGLFIATCNKIASLPPELRRRFTLGTFFVDLPDAEEQSKIWPLWIKRYELAEQELPPCKSWSGAEIRACCDVAYRAGLTLKDASRYVVPVIKSAPDQVDALRKLANGRFISASYPGTYKYDQTEGTGRKMEL